ncbi:MAG: hypothetical protein QM706_09505 [Nitrospira sp.]
MIATNAVTAVSPSLRAQVQKLRADALSRQEFESLDPDVIGGLIDILDQAELTLAALAEEEERIQSDATLSDLGRVKEMTKVVQGGYKKLQVIEKKATERRAAYDSETVAIYAAPTLSNDSQVSALREMEIRQRLQGAPVHEQMRAYEKAARNGWRDTLRALKDSEAFGEDERLKDFITRVDQERFEEKEPKRWARLKALKYSAEVLQALAVTVELRMSGYGQMLSFSTPPTQNMDLGLPNIQEPPKRSMHADTPSDKVQQFQ